MDRYINSTFETAPKNTIGVAFAAKKVSGVTSTNAALLQSIGSSEALTTEAHISRADPLKCTMLSICQVACKNGRVISLGIWDTAGAERFEALSRMYYNGAKAAVLAFDPCNARSFEKLKFWVRSSAANSMMLVHTC